MSNSRRPISANFTRLSLNQKSRFIVGSNKSSGSAKKSSSHSKYRNAAAASPWELKSDFSPTIKVTSLQPAISSSRRLKQHRYSKQRPQTSNGVSTRRQSGGASKMQQSESNAGLLTYLHHSGSKVKKENPARFRTSTSRKSSRSSKASAHAFNSSYSSSNVRLDLPSKHGGSHAGSSTSRSSSSSGSRFSVSNNANFGLEESPEHQHHSQPQSKDSVIFAIDPKQPLCPIVFRDEKAKSISRERLNLDNRNLSKCPMLRGEENLRLLNYENNLISKISNLNNLGNLIFLDLYNNRIAKMENLQCLPMLRVLMLGRNQICKIEQLESLHCLDVLDLHSNQISKIENLNHLSELRVLNLAGNEIASIENIFNLKNLVELNLRRNIIYKVDSLLPHQKLQRILLSNNNLREVKALMPISLAKAVQQLTIDNNPFYDKFSNSRSKKNSVHANSLNARIVPMFGALKQLNNFEISDAIKQQLREQSRAVSASSSSSSSSAALTATSAGSAQSAKQLQQQSMMSIAKAKFSTNPIQNEDVDALLAQTHDLKENIQSENKEAADQVPSVDVDESKKSSASATPVQPNEPLMTSAELISQIRAEWLERECDNESAKKPSADRLKHFELDVKENRGNVLRMYGCGLPKMERNGYFSNLAELHFFFVPFNALTKYFNSIKALKTVQALTFHFNHIHSLYQIDALSVVSHIKRVDFGAANESNRITVTAPTLYRLYCIFRLPNIVEIDHRAVSAAEKQMADEQFSFLRNEWKNAQILLTRGFCAPILSEIRNINADDERHYKQHINDIFQKYPFAKDARADESEADLDSDDMSEFLQHQSKARQSIDRAIAVYKSRRRVREMWPRIVAEYIHEVVRDLHAS